ncbi:MAG: hypothetical protein Q4E18_03740 [Clostridia bacterium]|nr:hypothetical protein [Clostridia bacterium]
MATIEFDEYVRAVIAYTERLCDDVGLLRNMVKILIDTEEGQNVTEEPDNRTVASDQAHD